MERRDVTRCASVTLRPVPLRHNHNRYARRGGKPPLHWKLLDPALNPALFAAAIAVIFAVGGVIMTGSGSQLRFLIPISGALLIGVGALGLLPDVSRDLGWGPGLALAGGGYLSLTFVDRFAVSICPSCSHAHHHEKCAAQLHGFAIPLLIAAAVHAFVDGWSLVAVGEGGIKTAVLAAIVIHKIPEGLALGAILRASTRTFASAVIWSALAESATLAGAVAGLSAVRAWWVDYPLALAAGTFVFLGVHALDGAFRARAVRRRDDIETGRPVRDL